MRVRSVVPSLNLLIVLTIMAAASDSPVRNGNAGGRVHSHEQVGLLCVIIRAPGAPGTGRRTDHELEQVP
jgi:hypothetical protein